MLVKYYKDPELAYTNRRRYHTISKRPYAQEEQRSILLGDGATTQLKTKIDNICNYVTIDNTRWYVTSYIYLNGGQVQLNLQRDVVGEFGLENCFGKIERGYTENILRNRKELDLNQVLKKRIYLIPDTVKYGNYSVNTHEKEMWGVLYLVKPTGIDPNTGEQYGGNININIPNFIPKTVDYDFIPNGTEIVYNVYQNVHIRFLVQFSNYNASNYNLVFKIDCIFNYNNGWNADVKVELLDYDSLDNIYEKDPNIIIEGIWSLPPAGYNYVAIGIGTAVANYVILNRDQYFDFPVHISESPNELNYNGVTILLDGKYYSYTETMSSKNNDGKIGTNKDILNNLIIPAINNKTIYGETVTVIKSFDNLNLKAESYEIVYYKNYNYTILTESDIGSFSYDLTKQLIDEPYTVLVCPLFNVTISEEGTTKYTIDKDRAFMVFNTIIQFLSGENTYLVDAQIYPYCPILTGVSCETLGIPFFSVNSTSYEHSVTVQPMPSSDVKKEYIEREYSIVAPDQSSKISFNFYDYVKTIDDYNGVNYANLRIRIKTALKPFAIIASAVIIPDGGTLMNMTYGSDLRGCQPSSNGFECSLATNQFEQYKRQNSNYQSFFNLDKEELQKQHNVERVNDSVSAVINTISGATMGAIAGKAISDYSIMGFNASGAGAIAGAAVAGGVVGTAMAAQTAMNEGLRKYEERLQQERFNLTIGTVKNLPNSVSRISSFNEIIVKDFWFILETYECTDEEKTIVDNFISHYGYGIGVYDLFINYIKEGWFIKGEIITSNYAVNLHSIAVKEFAGGIYLYEQI